MSAFRTIVLQAFIGVALMLAAQGAQFLPGHSCISHAQIPMTRSIALANGWSCLNCNGEAQIESLATPDRTWGPPYVARRICKVYVDAAESNPWYGDGSRCTFSYVKQAAPC